MGEGILEDLEDLVNFGVAREQRLSSTHLSKDGSHGPHIHACGVLSATEKNFWGTIP